MLRYGIFKWDAFLLTGACYICIHTQIIKHESWMALNKCYRKTNTRSCVDLRAGFIYRHTEWTNLFAIREFHQTPIWHLGTGSALLIQLRKPPGFKHRGSLSRQKEQPHTGRFVWMAAGESGPTTPSKPKRDCANRAHPFRCNYLWQ